MLKILVILMVCKQASMKISEISTRNYNSTVPLQFIRYCRNSVLFHIDDTTKHSSLIYHLQKEAEIDNYVINHEKIVIPKFVDNVKHSHVVYFNKIEHVTFYHFPPLVNVLLLTEGFDNKIKTIQIEVCTVRRVFLFDLINERMFYCYLSYIQGLVLRNISILDISNLLKGRLNLNGHVLKIGLGYAYTSQSSIMQDDSEGMALKELSGLLNFQYQFKIFHGNESFNRAVTQVSTKDLDFVIGKISVTYERNRIVDYTTYIELQSFNICYGPVIKRNITSDKQIVIILVILSLFFIILIKRTHSKIYHQSGSADLMMSVAPLLNQPYPQRQHLNKKSMKMLFLMWWLIGSCIVTAVTKVSLYSALLRKQNSISTIEEMLELGYSFESAEEDYYYIAKNCAKLNSTICNLIFEKFKISTNICDTVIRSYNGQVALVAEMAFLKYKIKRYCVTELTLWQKNNLKSIDIQLFGVSFHGWPVNKNSVLRKPFSDVLTNLHENGLIEKWLTNDIRTTTASSQKLFAQDYFEYVNLKTDLKPVYIVLFVGYFLSFMCFLTELLLNKTLIMRLCKL